MTSFQVETNNKTKRKSYGPLDFPPETWQQVKKIPRTSSGDRGQAVQGAAYVSEGQRKASHRESSPSGHCLCWSPTGIYVKLRCCRSWVRSWLWWPQRWRPLGRRPAGGPCCQFAWAATESFRLFVTSHCNGMDLQWHWNSLTLLEPIFHPILPVFSKVECHISTPL